MAQSSDGPLFKKALTTTALTKLRQPAQGQGLGQPLQPHQGALSQPDVCQVNVQVLIFSKWSTLG
jgi:hypothetical protein